MRVATLYDVHGNLPALDAVLKVVRAAEVDLIVVGGDVLPGPMPAECLDRLFALDIPVRAIRGNCEVAVLAYLRGEEPAIAERFRARFRWCADQLTHEQSDVLARWPLTDSLEIDGLGRVLFCHATPRNEDDIFTERTPETALVPILRDVDADIVVCGHTHMQFDRMIGGKRVVNAGSVGMPFEGQGAFWLLLGPDLEFRRTRYDYLGAAAAIKSTAYPDREEFAEKNVLTTPSKEEMLDIFTKAGLGAADPP